MLAQDDDDIQAISNQLQYLSPSHMGSCQAGSLGRECLPLRGGKFYKAMVQAVLLYGSKTLS
jgi:hypothetical protein